MFRRKETKQVAPTDATSTEGVPNHMRGTAFSRSINVNPLGKNTAEVRVLVPEDLQKALQALAVLRNTNVSDYVRDVLMEHAFGRLGVARLKLDGKNMED